MKKTAIIIVLIILFIHPLKANAKCPDDSALMDLISGICWECIFPMYIAGVAIDAGSHVNDITESEAITVCVCPTEVPPYERVGITISYWPVSYYVEVVKDPYCFPSFGLDINSGGSMLDSLKKGGGAEMGHEGNETSTFVQAHFWYFYILGLLDEALDTMCMETTSTDLVGLSEIDPLWQDDELAVIIQLEAYLFANYGAQLTCIADAISANVGYSISPLFWCVGSSGSLYPLTGHANNDDLLQAYELIVGRAIFRMHRQAVICDAACWYCQCMYTPIWIKHHYRDQVAWPVNAGFCTALGATDIMWGPGKNPPDVSRMDNLIFLLYRKRTCCMVTE